VIALVCTRANGASANGVQVLSGDEARHQLPQPDSVDLLWVDISDPQTEDVDWLRQTFHFHPLALEDVARQHQRARIDEYAGYYFCVLYAVRLDHEQRRVWTSELQFFWGPSYLVTIHWEPFPEIDDMAKRAREGALRASIGSDHRALRIPDLVYRLMDGVIDGYFPAVDAVAEWSEDVEEGMFEGQHQRKTLRDIFSLKKDLFHLRKTMAPSRELVNVLLRRDHALFGEEYLPYFQDLYDHTVRVLDSLDTYRDLLTAALDTHLSIVSNELSQTVKRMTSATVILMADALVAGIYGMNFTNMPELQWAYGYPYALGLMLVASLLLAFLFRRIGWL
jgi:magnesium transporter